MTESDTELMVRFSKKSDEIAFEEIVQRHHRNVINIIYRFLGHEEHTEDLAQEVFMKVFQSRKRYEPTAKFTTWIYRITANLCLNFIRDHGKKSFSSLDSGSDERQRFHESISDPRQKAPLEKLEDDEVSSIIKEALETLPANQRMAVILSKYHGLSYKEIAETLLVSVMAVKSLLSRAKENLRIKLQHYLKDKGV